MSTFQLFMVVAATVFILGGNGYAYEGVIDDTNSTQLMLDVYVDNTGKALITGYAEDIGGLPLLERSQYQYENDTKQLYAVTDSLTWKREDNWDIRFTTDASYSECRITFYLPGVVRLGRIDSSDGFEYFVTTSNDSFVVEFHEYDAESPTATIRYQQPFQGDNASSGEEDGSPTRLLAFVAISILALLSVIAVLEIWKSGGAENSPAQDTGKTVPVQETGEGVYQASEVEKEIEITSEMAAVMETLTDRERSVLNALIGHQGKLTQAEIRYEAGIPRSSLTGVILSLERRNIIIKKEYGRTNIIELSKWFKSGTKSD